MAKIAVITDLHFGARNDEQFIMDHQFKFLDEVFFPTLKQEGIKHLFVLGDTWDKRKILNIRTEELVHINFFERLLEENIESYFIIGNHDVYYKNTNKVNSISRLSKDYENIKVINNYEEITIDSKRFGLMSWINSENYEQMLDYITLTSVDIMCGHFEAAGFEMLPGVISDHGLDKDIFKKFEEVWSGHFHKPSKKGNFEYIGNPVQLTWADYGQRKGFIIYDTETNEKQYIVNKNEIFQVVFYDDSVDVMKYDYLQHKDKIVRVCISSFNIQNNAKFTLFIDSLQKEVFKLEVQELGTLYDTNISQAEVITDQESLTRLKDEEKLYDTKTVISEFVLNMNIDSVDNARLLEMINDLYDRAQEKISS